MSLPVRKRDVSKRRFALPNDIWVRKLRPPAFAVLAYLQYRHCRKLRGMPAAREIAMRTHMSVELARDCVEQLIRECLLTDGLVPALPGAEGRNFFALPDEVFYLGLGHGAITVYAYLLCCEDRRTHQCHPSYNTIAAATGLAVNTVMKHIRKLADRQFVAVERTSYLDRRGMKWNGNNLYTILPIQQAAGESYRRQLAELELIAERQRVAGLLREREGPA